MRGRWLLLAVPLVAIGVVPAAAQVISDPTGTVVIGTAGESVQAPVAVSNGGDARGYVSVSHGGNAGCCEDLGGLDVGVVGVTTTGDAQAGTAISGSGNANGNAEGVSLFGDAYGQWVAVSGFGDTGGTYCFGWIGIAPGGNACTQHGNQTGPLQCSNCSVAVAGTGSATAALVEVSVLGSTSCTAVVSVSVAGPQCP